MPSMDSVQGAVRRRAGELGFSLCGFTAPDPPERFGVYAGWIAAGMHGEMVFLALPKAMEARARPLALLPSAQSWIVLAMPYPRPQTGTETRSGGLVAAYALGDDYHEVIAGRLRELCREIDAAAGRPVEHRLYVDAGPVLERELASRAGLGWIGRNSMLIHPRLGSFFFLAEILTAHPFPPDSPFPADRCGTCERCLQACPTGCIRSDRTIDARRCIACLTIEKRGPIPEELRGSLGRWIFGCDVCQTVCPWNRRPVAAVESRFQPRAHFPILNLEEELALGEEAMQSRFRKSALRRAGRVSYRRNLILVLGNTGQKEAIPALRKALEDPESAIREAAAWAIARIDNPLKHPIKQPGLDL